MFGDGRVPRWGWSQVHRLLTNPNYKGDGVAWRHAPRDSHTSYRPEEEWVRLPEGVTPAIVDPEVWDAAQERLRANRGDETRDAQRPCLLRGHIFCATCGERRLIEVVWAPVAQGQKKAYRHYRCASRARDRWCGSQAVPADAIEAWAWERVDAVLRDPGLIARRAQESREQGPDPSLVADRDAAARALDKLGQQLARLVRRLRDAEDDLADLIEKEIAGVEEERRRVRATLGEIEARLAEQAGQADQLDALADYCATVAANLEGFDFDQRRLALAAFDVRVVARGRDAAQWRISGSAPIEDFGAVSRSASSPGRRSARRRRR